LGIIVIGADTHKDSHTFAAASGVTGEVVGDRTVAACAAGFGDALRWARGLEGERVWAIGTAGMSRVAWSGFSWRAGSGSCGWRRS
jgi:hypothetical protein